MKITDTRLNCPKCKGLGFKLTDVGDRDTSLLRLKCSKANCGEWSLADEWMQTTASAWREMADKLTRSGRG